ncbi:MAG: tetratricopeptide repeat protein [Candidatus Thiodiazotropha sp. 6PLUC4]
MKPSLYLSLLSLAIVSGCSSPILNNGPQEATLADLKSEPVKIEKSAIAPSERDEVIENYRALLKLKPDQRLHSEATRRLADLELERSETKLLSDDEMVQSSDELNQSIELYSGLIEKDPDYAASDLVLYQLARAYELKGDMAAMMQTLNTMITKYPQSEYWQEARFRQGERFFVEQKFKSAEQAYGDILKKKTDTPYYDRSLFKHGWSLFKLNKVEQGLDSFTQLLDRNLSTTEEVDTSKLSPADQELLKETLRVISLTFSELGGAQRISQYFNSHGHRNYEYMIYQGLGNLYLKQERIQDAAEAYLAFVNLNPAHPQSPRLSVEVVDIYTKNGFPAKAIESKKAFTQHYAVSGDAWKKLGQKDQSWLNDQLRVYLKELAEYHHALAQRSRKQGTKKITAEQAKQGSEAAHWYRLYLDAFPTDPKAGNISFLLGELLFELKSYPDAVVAYEQSAYKLPTHDKRAEAGYATLLAYAAEQKNLSSDPGDAWRKKGVESALRFCDTFPNDSRRARVLTEAADQLLDLKDFGRARGAALQVANLKPPAEKKLRRTAWTVAAHAAFEQKDFAAAEQAYQQALSLSSKKGKQRGQLEERLAASIYQQGSDSRTQGDHSGAAKQFLRIASLAPASTILATAEYDAAASMIAAGDWAGSVKILESYKKRYPKSELIPEVNSKLAVAYMETGQPLKAAAQLTVISKQSGDVEIQREAGWQAAELYEKAGKKSKAITSYKRYVKQFPKPFDQALEARQKLVTLYQQTGAWGKRDWWLKQIVKVDAKAGKQRTDRSRYLAATASVELAEPARKAFRRVKLKAPLEKNLKAKKSKMQTAINAYKRAAEYGVAEVTTAATHRIGEIYQQFGSALMASERPKGLNAEELEQYDILLEEQAYPFEEKAIVLYQSNIERTPQGIYDKWVKKSFAELANLIPGRYAKQEKWEVWVDALN